MVPDRPGRRWGRRTGRAFRLRLTALADLEGRGDVYHRLRAALKEFLRRYGLRCLSIEEERDDGPPLPRDGV